MKPRSEIASEEITTNPIFLLQRRRVIPNLECPAEYDSDLETTVHPDTKEELDDDKLLKFGWGTITWLTEKVFATREEGEKYGEVHKYNYGEGRKGIDWMVYCVPCKGELAELLEGYYRNHDGLCCVCFHDLDTHIDEGDVWRCHCLGTDANQCECALRKDRAERTIRYYDLGIRDKERADELAREMKTGA